MRNAFLVVFAMLFWWPSYLTKEKLSRWAQVFEEGSGVEVLPAEVLEAKELLKKNPLIEFSLSPEFRNNLEINQRMAEGLYPIRLREESAIMVSRPGEKTSCTPLIEGRNVWLLSCI